MNNKIISDLKDPEGWTVENNPHPPNDITIKYAQKYNPRTPYDELDVHYFEYDEDGWHIRICHSCILRAKYGSGNCQDNGDYFWCVQTGKRAKQRKELEHKYSQKRNIQTKLM